MPIQKQPDGTIVEVSPVTRENILAYQQRLQTREKQLSDELAKVQEAVAGAAADLSAYDELNPEEAQAAASAAEAATSQPAGAAVAPPADAPSTDQGAPSAPASSESAPAAPASDAGSSDSSATPTDTASTAADGSAPAQPSAS